ncbi:MAG: hypothetical protein D6690_12700 [Nitrospirae bacterium]|nr:MAG: hypothetical protein D6690_12700 [Nitrospirota bacterium]
MNERWSNARWFRGFVLVGWWALGVSGCSLFSPASHEAVRTFVLMGDTTVEEEISRIETATSPSASIPTLLVPIPRARSGFDSARMIYVSRDYEVLPFAYHRWVDVPARMLHPLIVEALEASGWRVIQPPSQVPSDFRLDVQNVLLQHEFIHVPSQVQFRARAQLVEIDPSRIRGIREFVIVEDAPSDDPYGGVVAANRAVATFLRQLNDWLQVCMDSSGSHGC